MRVAILTSLTLGCWLIGCDERRPVSVREVPLVPPTPIVVPIVPMPNQPQAVAPVERARANDVLASESRQESTAMSEARLGSEPLASTEASAAQEGADGVFGAPAALPAPLVPILGQLRPRGASTMSGQIRVEPAGRASRLSIQVTGAVPGQYVVYRGGPEGCRGAPIPSEQSTGVIDMKDRTADYAPDERAARPVTDRLGQVSLTASEGTIETALDLPRSERDANVSILIEEASRSANPSLADSQGLVACGEITVPRAATPEG